jgi:hypothetical protein
MSSSGSAAAHRVAQGSSNIWVKIIPKSHYSSNIHSTA